MDTYVEKINRYRVVRCQHMSRQLVAQYRIHGIEVPEDEVTRELIWSFTDRQTADDCAREENIEAVERKWDVWYDVIDAGQATEVTRSVLF